MALDSMRHNETVEEVLQEFNHGEKQVEPPAGLTLTLRRISVYPYPETRVRLHDARDTCWCLCNIVWENVISPEVHETQAWIVRLKGEIPHYEITTCIKARKPPA